MRQSALEEVFDKIFAHSEIWTWRKDEEIHQQILNNFEKTTELKRTNKFNKLLQISTNKIRNVYRNHILKEISKNGIFKKPNRRQDEKILRYNKAGKI